MTDKGIIQLWRFSFLVIAGGFIFPQYARAAGFILFGGALGLLVGDAEDRLRGYWCRKLRKKAEEIQDHGRPET